MDLIKEHLLQSFNTGFIDRRIHSNKEYLPQLLTNDKLQGKKVLTSILKELRELKKNDEFWFSVAFVTTSGVATLINTLIDLESRNIKGKILVSQYLNFTQPEALKRLLQFKNIELKIVTEGDFHSKGYLFKKGEIYNLIIGSSNLTATALCSNKEWNLKISAAPTSHIIFEAINEFTSEFENAIPVNLSFIEKYEAIYKRNVQLNFDLKEELYSSKKIVPNAMQIEALANLDGLRAKGKNKALLISATGTGKTYLSAFDVKKVNPKKFLFVVHRENITKAAMKTFKSIFGDTKTMGLYTGNNKELEADFIFSTVQTISKQDNLELFEKNYFDYIVIDETHRAGAASYQRILEYFNPKFLLGMTATPERGDNFDIFQSFDYNIAYEIRLHRALEEEMLSPFHYFGVTDITVDGEILEEKADFNLLTSTERVDRIIENAKLYGCDSGVIRGLIFCYRVEECIQLSNEFNQRGFKTVALTGDSSEEERTNAINRLESDSITEKLDYIFTRDIFNEGIDIPSVNQIIMLRPTQSAIVFVQQLGRGLRKTNSKEYLTVIDFIGNYTSSFLVPVALYGDTTYNKDNLRKLMASGSNMIPGASTINFDEISKKRIFEAIDTANMQLKKDLVSDYIVLKAKLGRIPLMMDFIEHGSRDPFLYANYSKSYFNFVASEEKELQDKLSSSQVKLLELFSNEINNSKRVEENIILLELFKNGQSTLSEIKELITKNYGYIPSNETMLSAIKNINFMFVTENKNRTLTPVNEIYNIQNISLNGDKIRFDLKLKSDLTNKVFFEYLFDNVQYSIHSYTKSFLRDKFINGFVLYCKYSRKDVFRILNWETNPLAQNVGGYIISSDKTNCPIFVNYHKEEHISNSTKYEDGFLNKFEFQWMSKSKRNLSSPDIITIRKNDGLRIPLFIKKSNDEGTDFYYMGDITPIDETFIQTTLDDDSGKKVSVVKVVFSMNQPVDDNLYDYITEA
jgi:superfamily II DNA or RNA helicase/HKD family nuclease